MSNNILDLLGDITRQRYAALEVPSFSKMNAISSDINDINKALTAACTLVNFVDNGDVILKSGVVDSDMDVSNEETHITLKNNNGDIVVHQTIRSHSGPISIGSSCSITGNLTFSGTLMGGTIPWARMENTTIINAGTGLSGGGTIGDTTINLSIINPFNPAGNYANLRARATTQSDVGLANVDNMSATSIRTDTSRRLRVRIGAPATPMAGDIWLE